MRKIFLFILFNCSLCCAYAQGNAPSALLPSMAPAAGVLQEQDDVKKLILKYDAAPDAQKPSVRREIQELETRNEADFVKKTDLRIKRQEDKIKELKKRNEDRRKNSKKIVAERVDYLLSKESVEKVKGESLQQKIADKAKQTK